MAFHTLATVLRVFALVLTAGVGTLFYFGLQRFPIRSVEFLTLGAALIATLGVSIVLIALASVLSRRETSSDAFAQSLTRLQHQLGDLQARTSDIALTVEKMAHKPPEAPSPVTLAPGVLAPIQRQLEELRDISLLSEDERNSRLQIMDQERKLARVRSALATYERKHWADAETIILQLEREYRGDHEIRQLRVQFDEARRIAEDPTVAQAQREIDQFLGMSAYDQAAHAAKQVIANFPMNAQAKALSARVHREFDSYRELSISRALDEVRNDCDSRQWRQAFERARRLLDRYPNSPRVERLLLQMPTIQSNAEIQERQEMEVRIQELVRNEQLPEAVKLGEDLVARYPDSPQAEQMELLLPRLQQLIHEQINIGDEDSDQAPASA